MRGEVDLFKQMIQEESSRYANLFVLSHLILVLAESRSLLAAVGSRDMVDLSFGLYMFQCVHSAT
jgi:hypothetical protein